jgi:hypothetical protein
MTSASRAGGRAPRRVGCIGRLGELALLLAVGVVAGCVFLVAIDFVFARWAFYLGGTTRLTPVWQGIGRLRGPGGDYVLYIWFAPAPGGQILHLPTVNGAAYLCTPRGERFVLRATGNFLEKRIGTDSDGKEMVFTMHHRPLFGGTNDRPRFELRGAWRDDTLELDDRGSLSREFLPDATLYTGPARNQPRGGAHASVVLHEVPWSVWTSDCRAPVP